MIVTLETDALGTPSTVTKRSDNRRENLRRMVGEDGQFDGPLALSKALGYANASFIVQMIGPNPSRDVTEKTARKIERTLKLEDGSLDWPPEDKPASRAKAPTRGTKQLPVAGDTPATIEIIRQVGRVCDAAGINLPPLRFSDAVAHIIADTAETGVQPSDEKIARLLQLLSK